MSWLIPRHAYQTLGIEKWVSNNRYRKMGTKI